MSVSSTLTRPLQPDLDAHPGLNGVYLLSDPLDAFATRIQLLQRAALTVDLQYYIWANDTAGRHMLDAVHRAAERGIKVRLLLDDFGCLGADELFSALNMHPRIEIRLFNPLISRRLKWTGYFTNFSRIHRRMHNKAFIVDHQVTIVGGRNIGDIYFDGGEESSFVDLDAFSIGPVARDVSADFDRYWESASSYPAVDFLPSLTAERQQQLLAELAERVSELDNRYQQAVQETHLLTDILSGHTQLTWAPVVMVSDDPAKILDKCNKSGMVSQQLALALGEPRQRVTLVSPYLIPMKAGVGLFRDLVAKGVAVSVLTNSYSASDVPLVHIAYSKYRKALLKAGVELFEMRSSVRPSVNISEEEPAPPADKRSGTRFFKGSAAKRKNRSAQKAPRKKTGLLGSKSHGGKAGIMGSKRSSLHAKTFAVDSRKLFVGSLNFDPRSTRHNTELGFIIESPDLAMQLEAYFDTVAAETCYKVTLSRSGNLCWMEKSEGQTRRHPCEPKTTCCSRFLCRCCALLPMDSFL